MFNVSALLLDDALKPGTGKKGNGKKGNGKMGNEKKGKLYVQLQQYKT